MKFFGWSPAARGRAKHVAPAKRDALGRTRSAWEAKQELVVLDGQLRLNEFMNRYQAQMNWEKEWSSYSLVHRRRALFTLDSILLGQRAGLGLKDIRNPSVTSTDRGYRPSDSKIVQAAHRALTGKVTPLRTIDLTMAPTLR